jgi:hypothetical protein
MWAISCGCQPTPFGNFGPKLFWVMALLAHANIRLEQTAAHWSAAMAGSFGPDVVEHRATASEAVFAMRRAADELVTLTAVLEDRIQNGVYPTKPRYDSIGTAFYRDRNPKAELRGKHDWFLLTPNDLANAHKHSFVDSDTTLAGRVQPCATALHLPSNNLDKHKVRIYVVALDDLASGLSGFLADVMAYLEGLAQPLRESEAE